MHRTLKNTMARYIAAAELRTRASFRNNAKIMLSDLDIYQTLISQALLNKRVASFAVAFSQSIIIATIIKEEEKETAGSSWTERPKTIATICGRRERLLGNSPSSRMAECELARQARSYFGHDYFAII